MTLDLIEVKPRLNVKKVVIITIVLILIISLISTAIFFGVRQYNKNLSIIERDILAKNRPAHELFYSDNAKQNKIVERVSHIYNSDYRRVFLTFDDGPSKSVTIPILDILKQNNVKATFFVLGSNAERYPEIVKRAYQEGHYIANHGYSHQYSQIYSSPETVLQEFNQCNSAVAKAIDVPEYNSHLFRFPGGSVGGKYANLKAEAVTLLEQNNIMHVDWNALTGDAEKSSPDEEYLMNNLQKTTQNKNSIVILMHDAQAKRVTVEFLPKLIEFFQQQGYQFENFYSIIK